jgi:hypothetical protein
VSDVCQEYFRREGEDGRKEELNNDWKGLTVMARDPGEDGKDFLFNLMWYFISLVRIS